MLFGGGGGRSELLAGWAASSTPLARCPGGTWRPSARAQGQLASLRLFGGAGGRSELPRGLGGGVTTFCPDFFSKPLLAGPDPCVFWASDTRTPLPRRPSAYLRVPTQRRKRGAPNREDFPMRGGDLVAASRFRARKHRTRPVLRTERRDHRPRSPRAMCRRPTCADPQRHARTHGLQDRPGLWPVERSRRHRQARVNDHPIAGLSSSIISAPMIDELTYSWRPTVSSALHSTSSA